MTAWNAWPDVSGVARPTLRHRVRESAQALTLRMVQRRLARRTIVSEEAPALSSAEVIPHFDRERTELLALVRSTFDRAGIAWREEIRPWAQRPLWHLDAEPWTVWQVLRRAASAAADQPDDHEPACRSDAGLEVRPTVRHGSARDTGQRSPRRWLQKLLTPEFTETHLLDPRLGDVVPLTDSCPAGDRWLLSRSTRNDDRLRARLAVEGGLDLAFGSLPRVTAVINFPIDVVYTWVDADDADWQVQRFAHPPGQGLVAAADVAARFVQRDELRYSLRSIEEYAPWVRRIWVVTNGQRPRWLLDHPRVTVVTHQDIWPDPSELPVFNSHAIEANLHRIAGLADRYLYFNDDMFLGRPVSPETFFTVDGRPRVFPSRYAVTEGPPVPSDRAPDAAGKNNRDLIRLLTGRTVSSKFQHAPYAISRELVCELESRVPEIFRRTGMARYRSITDVTVSGGLHHGYGLATGRAVVGTLRYRYVDLDKDSRTRVLRTIGDTRYADSFCLNAVEQAPPGPEVFAALSAYFPHPAEWERPACLGAWEAEWDRELEHVDWSEPAPPMFPDRRVWPYERPISGGSNERSNDHSVDPSKTEGTGK